MDQSDPVMTPERFQQIEELYHAARDDRGVLDTADPELRGEVEALLAQNPSDGLIDHPAWEAAPSLIEPRPAGLASGVQLGPYEIEALLGKGGMGEVYKARDTTLKRDVALKVLPAAFSSDPERLARFQREAEVLASLNHPNIAAIYGVAEADGVRALVMEFVEGSSPSGPMEFADAWKVMAQVAEGLEYAHERRVIHRDLKPANLMVTPQGRVKILDFGLAKAFSAMPSRPQTHGEDSPTLTMGATQAGMILGTAAYMAPEQVKAKEADRRADIWAFGVVLYELLTGERPFKGKDSIEVMARVMTEEPSLEKVPPRVRRLLRDCFRKEPEDRLRWVGDAGRLLDDPAASAVVAEPQSLPASTRSKWLWPSGAAVLALAFAAVSLTHFRETPPQQQTTRTSITLPENSNVHSFALSPDGRTLVIAATVSGKRQLYLRLMDALPFQPMAFTEDATFPFWSPDSRFIGFFAQGKLKKVAASGGPSLVLCDASDGRGGSWNRDDVIVFSPASLTRSIQRVAAAGGVPAEATKAQGAVRHPVFLPDGRHLLFTIFSGIAEQTGIWFSSLDGKAESKENRRVLADVSSVLFAPSARSGQPAHLLFIRQNTLMAVPFDAASAQVSGDVFPIADGVGLTTNGYYAPVTVSGNGVLLYETGGAAGGAQMVWYDRTGKQLATVGAPGQVGQPAISPDEKLVAFRRATGAGADLWLRDLSRGTETLFISDPFQNFEPQWSPKGDRIAYSSSRKGGVSKLYQKAANGSGQDELLLLESGLGDEPNQWSRDGRFIVFYRVEPKTKRDIWVLPMEGSAAERKPIPFLQSDSDDLFGQLSPDSHWMAFNSDRSGRREVYVRPFPPGEGEYPISIAGGDMPRWRGDGKELFFEGLDGKMMAVPVKASAPAVMGGAKPTFEAGAPVALFDAHMVNAGASNSFEYDVTADGKRFLVNTAGRTGASAPPLTVVTNWQAGLKK